MIYVQVTTEIEVDEETLIENFPEEWETFGGDVIEFIDWLVDTNAVSVDDLGQVAYQSVMPL